MKFFSPFRPFLAIFLSSFLTGGLFAQEGPVEAATDLDAVKTSDFKGVRRAVLVGINEYQHLGRLRYAGADVEALGKSLVNAGFAEKNVVVIHDKATRSLQPDRQKIMKQIELTLESSGPDDLVFLAFCMHGVRIFGKTYLAPYEASPPKFDGDTERLETFIPIDWVYEKLQACPAGMKLMMVDACQERIFDGDTRSLSPEQQRLQALNELESPRGIMQMVACAPGEYSYESEKLGHGVYTHFLLEALGGKADTNHDGIVTLKEIDLYVSRETNAYVREMYKSTQRPSIRGEMEGDLPLAEATRLSKITFPRDLDDLHRAVERLAEGGILTIQPGVHRISEPLIVDKSIQIIGATGDPEDTTLESNGEGVLKITADAARIQGLTLRVKTGKNLPIPEDRRNMTAEENARLIKSFDSNSAVFIPSGLATLNKCLITSDAGQGILINGEKTNPTLEQCKVFDCGGVGIKLSGNAKAVLNRCESYKNVYSGLQVGEESDPTVLECRFFNGKMNGIIIATKGKGVFEKCEVYGNTLSEIEVSNEADPMVRDCRFYDGKGAGISVANKGKGTFEKCDVYGNTKAGIIVMGESDPVVRECKFYDGKQAGILINEKGNGIFGKCEVYGNAIGIVVANESDPIVNNCKFYNGKIVGIMVTMKGKGAFEKCEIFGNVASGIIVAGESNPTVIECKFYDGKNNGVFVSEKGKGTFEKCEVYGNALPGIEVREDGDPTIRSCDIRNNGGSGIYVHTQGRGTYERNTLSENAGGNWKFTNPGPIRRVGNKPNQ